jgi:DNA-binding NtrC family response regulator
MPATVLLVEDDSDAAALIAERLRAAPESLAVAAVPSARRAFQYLAAHPVDVVLLDYRLPDLDGLACLGKIRRRRPDLPVVVITAAGSEEIAVEVMKLGATDYLVKQGNYVAALPFAVRGALGARALAGIGAAPRTREPERPLKEIVRDVELATIRARLRVHGNHRNATARSLGCTRESLWAKMRRLGFRPAPRRGPEGE